MRFLDTNVFLRYLTRDDEVKAEAARELFLRLRSGEERATTSESVVAEIVYVLASRAHYGLGREDIRARVRPLLGLTGLVLPQRALLLRAVDLYASYAFLDIEDALSLAHLERLGLDEITSYDSHFDRIPGIQRTEP